MRWLSVLAARLRSLLRRDRLERELDAELRFHLDQQIQENLEAGMSPGEARLSALRATGRVTHIKEECRESLGLRLIDDLRQDVRHSGRSLVKNTGFTIVAVLTLALGIGANTAIFSIVNGVLLRPLGYPHPAQLMYLNTGQFLASVPEYLEFRQFNRSFANVGAFRSSEANLVAGGRALRVRAAIVDAHLLNTLGLQVSDGRRFTNEDSAISGSPLPGASAVTAPVMLISYGLWQSAFSARPIVGDGVDVDGRRLTVVGVMSPGSDLMDTHPDVWFPLGFTETERLARNNHNLSLIGRLKETVSVAEARAELRALTATWAARAGVTPGATGHAGHVFVPPGVGGDGHSLAMTPLSDEVLGRVRRSIWVLQAAVALVLLIACANIANLLLARAETRQREFAVLAALGASRGRLVRKAMTESVMLFVAGGALGVLIARAGIKSLVLAHPTSLPRIGEVVIDQTVMLLSLTIALACGLLFGLAITWYTRSDAIAAALKSGPRGSGDSSRHHVRRALVSAETALALIVLVGAGLLFQTVQHLTAVDGGLDRTRLVTFSITLPRASFDNLARVRTFQMLLEQLRAIPGIDGASAMTSLPLERPFLMNQTEITNNSAAPGTIAIDYQRVMSGFFETTEIPILQGRAFRSTDAVSAGAVAVVNETMASTYWSGQNPLGQQLRPGGTTPWFTVIGVAKDVKQTGVDHPVGAEAYVFVDQLATESPTSFLGFSPTTMHVVMRSTLPLATLAPAITRTVRDVDPAVPVARLRKMDEVFIESIRRPRLLAQLIAAFGALALLLAAIGTYGMFSYMVAERRREIAIRMALGAERGRVLAQVMVQGLWVTTIGIMGGLAGAFALNRLIASLLFGVQPTDAPTLVAVITTITLVATLACWLPARRATKVDPLVALRCD